MRESYAQASRNFPAPLPPEMRTMIDAHPEWQKRREETSHEYAKRMSAICRKLIAGATKEMPL